MKLQKALKIVLVAGALVVAAALVATACGNGSSTKALSSVSLNFKVVGPDGGNVGSDGNKHDTFTLLNPKVLQVGQEVTLSIENYDDMPHSFTSPELGINLMISPAKTKGTPSVTTYTFTPTRLGTFRWFCAIPCDTDNDGWAMKSGAKGSGQDNFMAGYITVSD